MHVRSYKFVALFFLGITFAIVSWLVSSAFFCFPFHVSTSQDIKNENIASFSNVSITSIDKNNSKINIDSQEISQKYSGEIISKFPIITFTSKDSTQYRLSAKSAIMTEHANIENKKKFKIYTLENDVLATIKNVGSANMQDIIFDESKNTLFTKNGVKFSADNFFITGTTFLFNTDKNFIEFHNHTHVIHNKNSLECDDLTISFKTDKNKNSVKNIVITQAIACGEKMKLKLNDVYVVCSGKITYTQKVVTASGEINISFHAHGRDDCKLVCKTLLADINKSGNVECITTDSGVTIKTLEYCITAQKAIFSPDKIKLDGNVKIVKNGAVLCANSGEYDVSSGRVRILQTCGLMRM